MTSSSAYTEHAFASAKDQYVEWGVDVDLALARLSTIAVSLHCWQGDDVGGFENSGQELGGGLAVTGHYPGKARTPDELRRDLEKALSLLPGSHRVNLHASYAETGGRKIERDALEPAHFEHWIDWARSGHIRLDFNPTYFAHRLASDGYTLAHLDAGIRQFWIDHNRVAAWVIGARAVLKALLAALLEPTETLRQLEADGDTTARLALLEEQKALPFGTVWDHYCLMRGVPTGRDWLAEVKAYERDVLSRR